MSTVVEIRNADDPRDVIHQAVQRLVEGKLVALPTDTVYAVSALSLKPEAVVTLRELAGGSLEIPCVMALKGAQEALDYVPDMCSLARRLVRRAWPGPLTILFDSPTQDGLASSLPADTCRTVVCKGAIPLRVPDHPIVSAVLRLLPGPLVFASETRTNGSCETSAAGVRGSFGDAVDFIIDDGPSRTSQPSTIVGIAEDRLRVVRQGALTETALNRLSRAMFLFVCTGNTCRSPMAEAWFRKTLAEKLNCPEEELEARGFIAASAGMAAVEGAPASAESVEVLNRRQIDISRHLSQPLNAALLEQADRIYTMTQSQRASILCGRPDLIDRVWVLQPNGQDIVDPVGGSLAEYEACEREIERAIRAVVNELELT